MDYCDTRLSGKVTLKGAFQSFLFGLFGTRQQMAYALVGSYVYILLRAVAAAKTIADYVALLNAAWPAVAIALGAWLGDKVREDRTNGVSKGSLGEVQGKPDKPQGGP